MHSAETLFLSLNIPENDVARTAKMKIANAAPGFKIIDVSHADEEHDKKLESVDHLDPHPSGGVDWTGDYVYLLCVTHDDGLRFELAQTNDGEEPELHATFNGTEFTEGAASLRRLLAASDKWPMFRLRAIVILQQRVFEQMQVLYSSQDDMEASGHGDGTPIRRIVYEQAMKLRRLEFELLEKAYEDFEEQKMELAEHPVVKEYLAESNPQESAEIISTPAEDFA